MAEQVSRASMDHAGLQSHGASGDRVQRTNISNEAQRRTAGPEATAYYAAKNPAINTAKTHLNIDMVNDGEGGFRETQSIDEVVVYGDERRARVSREIKLGHRHAVTTVGHLPWAYCEPDGTHYQPIGSDGEGRLGNDGEPMMLPRYRIREDKREEAMAYFADFVKFQQSNVLPGGQASMHGYSINLDETRPHIQILSDPYHAYARGKEPDALANGYTKGFGSARGMDVPDVDRKTGEQKFNPDGSVKMIRESASRKMERYHVELKAHMLALGYEIEAERDSDRHDRNMTMPDYQALAQEKVLHAEREEAHAEEVKRGAAERVERTTADAIQTSEARDVAAVDHEIGSLRDREEKEAYADARLADLADDNSERDEKWAALDARTAEDDEFFEANFERQSRVNATLTEREQAVAQDRETLTTGQRELKAGQEALEAQRSTAVAEGRKEGHEAGRQEGFAEGKNEGLSSLKAEWTELGDAQAHDRATRAAEWKKIADGREASKQEGFAEGKREGVTAAMADPETREKAEQALLTDETFVSEARAHAAAELSDDPAVRAEAKKRAREIAVRDAQDDPAVQQRAADGVLRILNSDLDAVRDRSYEGLTGSAFYDLADEKRLAQVAIDVQGTIVDTAMSDPAYKGAVERGVEAKAGAEFVGAAKSMKYKDGTSAYDRVSARARERAANRAKARVNAKGAVTEIKSDAASVAKTQSKGGGMSPDR